MSNKLKSGSTIVIVDDDAQTRSAYATAFRRAGLVVHTAVDGLEALALVGRVAPDIVLTGIVMPRMDGFALVTALRANSATAQTAVVMVSHWGRPTDRDRAKKLGVVDFIERDITALSELVARVSTICSSGGVTFTVAIDANDYDAPALATALGVDEGFLCTNGKKLTLTLQLQDTDQRTITGKFGCGKK